MPTVTTPPPPDLTDLRARLKSVGQSHVLNFHDRLDPVAQRALEAQIDAIDLESLPSLIDRYVKTRPQFPLPEAIQPAPYFERGGSGWDIGAARKRGQDLLRSGRVAAFVVAGGQGSRLGYEGPKGCYPAGAVTGRPLFHVMAEAILGAKDRYAVRVPWYIMTSPLNHAATESFFKEHGFFGLNPEDVRLFQQGVMPSFDAATGRMLLASPGEIATNPDGHGGSLKALHTSGSLADMRRRGVEIISYFQVDNPIVNALDPVFIGLHADKSVSSGEMSSKMVPKANAAEKVGVFCSSGEGPRKGRVEVVEYSDLPAELAQATNTDGSLRFVAGSIAVHLLGVGFVEKLNTDARFELPYHRADKKVPCCDPTTGEPQSPQANNGVKLERFVFDALPLCERSVVLETDRTEEFAPIKNATGADSPESCSRIQTERAARWLEAAGVKVPRKPDGSPDCVLEISPRRATTAEELKAGERPASVERGIRLAW
ncbi:MAG: UTP--glucose-1-phosphate uridylyltransferase [Phycisphaerales bacterium]|nr:UTP--glucose-1-phosphate uridylyltransferase [Phycisphaerales bacterium]